MNKSHANLSFLMALLLFPVCSPAADPGPGEMRTRVEALEKKVAEMREIEQELRELRALLEKRNEDLASRAEIEELKREVADTRAQHDEWKRYDSAVHLAGYGSVAYTDNNPEDGRFNQVQFNPIFHYQFRDLVLFEAELELEVEDDSATALNLEYMTIDLLLHDNVVLLAGKFLSPLGQFRQNIHPGWINRLPSAPPGFGHGGAAPLAEVGLQARGAFELPFWKNALLNYAMYVGNGPELELGGHGGGHDAEEGAEGEEEEEEGREIEGIETEGFTRDIDDNKVFGGRIGILPIPSVELGGSIAMGDIALEGPGEGDRDYDVYGVDFSARRRAFGPDIIPLPHPSPRNNLWLRKNPWFATEVLPELARRVQKALR